MKLIYNDGEKERLEERYNDNKFPKMFQDLDKTYSINFTVTNPALAEYVLTSLMYNRLEDVDIGIQIESINYYKAKTEQDLKEDLHKAIDKVLGE